MGITEQAGAAEVESEDPILQAIAALTTTARRTRTVGAGTPAEHTEPADFAEIACHVLTAVAANVGGVETLLSGRPGSWEADLIRRIVTSTAGMDDDELLSYRTEPVRLAIDVEGTFDDFGLYDLYEEAVDELIRRVNAADEALFEATATAEERARLDQIGDATEKLHIEDERNAALVREAQAIVEGIIRRSEEAGDPLAAALAKATAAHATVERLWEQDQAAYVEAYRATARRVLSERRASVSLELLVDAPGASWAATAPKWDALTEELHQIARASTPLPMTGQAPDWSDGTPADALRRAGLTYTARAQH